MAKETHTEKGVERDRWSPHELLPIHSRKNLEKNLQEDIDHCIVQGLPISVMMLDIDYFKTINDEHGHPAGDQVLIHAADVVKTAVGRKGEVANCGGDEMIVLLPNLNLEEAKALGKRISKTMETTKVSIGKESVEVTVSIGIQCATKVTTAEQMIYEADKALYKAKETGRNRVETFSGMSKEATPIQSFLKLPRTVKLSPGKRCNVAIGYKLGNGNVHTALCHVYTLIFGIENTSQIPFKDFYAEIIFPAEYMSDLPVLMPGPIFEDFRENGEHYKKIIFKFPIPGDSSRNMNHSFVLPGKTLWVLGEHGQKPINHLTYVVHSENFKNSHKYQVSWEVCIDGVLASKENIPFSKEFEDF